MADYLVRVELYDADAGDYDALHEAMELLHMHKYFRTDAMNVKSLPNGTYIGQSALSAPSLRDAVQRAATPLSSKIPSIFVCEFSSWASYLYPYNSNA